MGVFKYQLKMRRLLDRIRHKYIILKQFRKLARRLDMVGAMHTVTAYPDFTESLKSINSHLDSKAADSDIILYDPDVLFWYDHSSTTLSAGKYFGLIDPTIISAARRISIRSYNTAYGDVNDFFQGTYMRMLANSDWKEPYKALKAWSKGVLAAQMYRDIVLHPSTRAEEIKKSTTPDPGKIPTNSYMSARDKRMECPRDICFSTNFVEQWDGVEANQSPGPAPRPGKDTHPTPPSTPSSGGLGIENISITWPRPSSAQKPNNDGLVSPIAFFTRKNPPLRPRSISRTAYSFPWRARAAVTDWQIDTARKVLHKHGYSDPATAFKTLGKNPRKWTYGAYMEWSKRTGHKLGYVHKGIDIFAPVGTEVYAIANGRVKYASRRPVRGAGLFIVLVHPGNKKVGLSRYLHLQAINPDIASGRKKTVRAGECIGVVGRSGYPRTVPHLHFETWSGPRAKGTNHLRPGDTLLNPNSVVPIVHGGRRAMMNVPKKGNNALITKLRNKRLPRGASGTIISPIQASIDDLELRLINGQVGRIVKAFPTFKLYFIEDDSGERKRFAFDDFYSYQAVKSIRIVRSRKIPADLCVLELTNVSGVLTNKKFRQMEDMGMTPRTLSGEKSKESMNPMDADTAKENPIASLLLKEGTEIHVRLGYSSNPELLDKPFTGKIVGIELSESEDLIVVTAQSFATELVQDIKGVQEPDSKSTSRFWRWISFGLASGDASTGQIFEEMLAEPEVLHFGRWDRGDVTEGRDLLTNKFQYVPEPGDDNIFAPRIVDDLAKLSDAYIFKNLKYVIYKTTIWDIFKEMEYRHPNFIGSPVPYSDVRGERMTYFFGLPNQLYFARGMSDTDMSLDMHLKSLAKDTTWWLRLASLGVHTAVHLPWDNTFSRLGALLQWPVVPELRLWGHLTHSIAHSITHLEARFKAKQEEMRQRRLRIAKANGVIRPFRRYHILTDVHNIIRNDIRADSRDVANTIVIQYPTGDDDDHDDSKGPKSDGTPDAAKIGKTKSFILKLDNALPTDEIRTQVGMFINAGSLELAKRYALTLLIKNMKDIYRGSITILGDASIKPYDVCYIMDGYNGMVGPVEVEQVVHILDRDTGFITEIKPDMLVQAAEWSLLSTAEAMAVIIEGFSSNHPILGAAFKFVSTWQLHDLSVIGLGHDAWNAVRGKRTEASDIGPIGLLIARKLIHFTQLAQPVIMSPLSVRGRVFAGGVPTHKIPTTLWESYFGKWTPAAELGINSWIVSVKDKIIESLSKVTGQYAVGDLIAGWDHRSLED